MEFKEYMKSLLPSFSKTQLVEDLDCITEELLEHVLPAYNTAVETFGNKALNSPEAKEADELFKKRLNHKPQVNHIKAIHEILKDCKEHCEGLDKMIDDKFALDITSAGLDIIRVNLLQLVEILGFVVRYSRRHLNYIVSAECAHYGSTSVEQSFSQGELEWLKGARPAFIAGLNVVDIPTGELEKKFKEVPEALVSHNTVDATMVVVGKKIADPLEMRFVPLSFNPIYHIRMRIAEYQANRYKEAQEERRSVELRLLLLKEQHNDRQNAKIEKQIEYQEERRAKLTYKLQKMEEKYVH